MAEFGGKDNRTENILPPYIRESFRDFLEGLDFNISPVMALSSKIKALKLNTETQSRIEEIVAGNEEKAKKILLLLDPETEDLGKDIYRGLDESSLGAIGELVHAHRSHVHMKNDHFHLPKKINLDHLEALKVRFPPPANIIPTGAGAMIDDFLAGTNKPNQDKRYYKTFGGGLPPSLFNSYPRKTE